MKVDAALVSKVARLSALDLAAGEAERLSDQLTRIVEHFEALRSVPDAELPAADAPHATPLRPDVADPASIGAALVRNAPELAHEHFVVPRVVSRNG